MKTTSFFSSNNYLFLPTSGDPKVGLVVDNASLAKNAFELYNPFSAQAKFLKAVSRFLFLNVNGFAKALTSSRKHEKGEFIQYLESKLNTTLVVSVYFATAKDKVVLQLQSNNKIIGYLKFPLNELGIKHIKNEIKAIEILSEKNIVAPAILNDSFNKSPYLFLQELQGEIKEVKGKELLILLEKFKKQKKYLLRGHPHISQLKEKLKEHYLQYELAILEKVCNSSHITYCEVYEHGDFAPWNLITTNEQIIPFDFEYFDENGLEYMDLIKYYFRTGNLLYKLNLKGIINYINKNIAIPEIYILLKVFLIKEILRKKIDINSYNIETEMLKEMEK